MGVEMRWIAFGAAVAVVAATAFGVAAASTTHIRARPKIPVHELVAIARSSQPRWATATWDRAGGGGDKERAEGWMEPGAIPPGPTNPRAYVIVLRWTLRLPSLQCTRRSAVAQRTLGAGHLGPGRGVTDFGLTARTPPGLKKLGRVVEISLISH